MAVFETAPPGVRLAISAAVWLNLLNICLTPEIDSERRAAHASQ
jgi:hypothetical protein